MKRASYFWPAVMAVLSVGGVAAAQVVAPAATPVSPLPADCAGPSETITALQSVTTNGDNDLSGRSAALCGYTWSAANLLERSVKVRASPGARFNLAAAYVNTGRYDAAIDLYRSAAADGQFSSLTLDRVDAGQRRWTRVNVADEANRRLETLSLIPTLATPAPVVSVNTPEGAATVMATIDAVHIPDDQALYRDSLIPRP
ncbi:hypothetical protein BH09PSE1_BH09PSE1_08070 [soil metagenome]